MRKKIILGIVILVVLAAVGGAVYFDKNYVILEEVAYHGIHKPRIVRINATNISTKYDSGIEVFYPVKCTPKIKKCTNLERVAVIVYTDTNLEYLSEMNNLEYIMICYRDGYCGRLETLPELPNLRKVTLSASPDIDSAFIISDENKYNFSNIEFLELRLFDSIDFNSLNYFENLHTLEFWNIDNDLTEEQVEELQARGINVEIV